MNITSILALLREDRTLDNIQKQLEGKVPQEVINALSAKMKKGKFDNEAMAILKGLQSALKEAEKQFPKEYVANIKKKIEYLNSHASMVHSILKKLKGGDSSFNANAIIDDYLVSESEPSSFWKEKYSQANNKPTPPTKEQKKFNTVGLGTARTKDLGDCFAILPKNFKAENGEYGFKELDYDKSHEELKTLSAEMAQKDTTDDENAKVNHWCVAASSRNYFDSYKGKDGAWRGNGNFIIFVKKNEDGSPDWNNRYLAWFGEDGETEIADKYDRHIKRNDLPVGAMSLFNKMIRQKKFKKKKPDERREVARRLNNTRDEREYVYKEEGNNEVLKKMIDYTFELARKGKQNQASQVKAFFKKELKRKDRTSFLQELEYLKNSGWYRFWSTMAGMPAVIKNEGEDREGNDFVFKFGPITYRGSAEEVLKFLDKCVADPSLISQKIDEGFAETKKKAVPMIVSDKIEFGEPTKRMLLSLGGNKKIMDKYFINRERILKGEKNNRAGRIFIPSPNSLSDKNGINVYFGGYDSDDNVVVRHHWQRGTMGNKKDPQTFEKLKDTLDKILKGDDESWVDDNRYR